MVTVSTAATTTARSIHDTGTIGYSTDAVTTAVVIAGSSRAKRFHRHQNGSRRVVGSIKPAL